MNTKIGESPAKNSSNENGMYVKVHFFLGSSCHGSVIHEKLAGHSV